jgi:hypothetical protein
MATIKQTELLAREEPNGGTALHWIGGQWLDSVEHRRTAAMTALAFYLLRDLGPDLMAILKAFGAGALIAMTATWTSRLGSFWRQSGLSLSGQEGP